MKYIVENVKRTTEEGIQMNRSYLFEFDSIRYINAKMRKLQWMRMNIDGFSLQSSFVMNDLNLCQETHFSMFKKRMKQLISIGCTTVVTYCEIYNIREFNHLIKKARHRMINSGIDFVVGVRTNYKSLTPAFIRLCKKHKVPIIIVDFTQQNELQHTIWQRIKEAMHSYQPLIIPNWDHVCQSEKEAQQWSQLWQYYATDYEIPTCFSFPADYVPFSKGLIQKLGLYPKKGTLLVSSDVDYILTDEHDNEKIHVVVLRGKVVKAGNVIDYKPGYGREQRIRLPGSYLSISEAYLR
ncbi:hypothetical protein [Alkalihalobacillus sp. LMS39]|uniref:hypothetical protein n=1 Tax=Alkalihalobacillus sp. LMS39 TaxID=2924032 RepID=UPI001FB44CD3|nr:hypothetical protein [Alkalihalobacillus sp. LMS39]UOE92329.1 hypothetical protein MM271_13825 [Alkalihalobacillus sp. LMS39]